MPGTLDYDTKWALGSVSTNKASGGNGILPELFQILNDAAAQVLHSIYQQIWTTQQGSQDWKRSVFIPVPKKDNATDCSSCHKIMFTSHASKMLLKILQARLQEYLNLELLDVRSGFRKGRGTRDQMANIHWIMEKAREIQENIYFFIDCAKAFDCVDNNKLEYSNGIGVPEHLTCLMRNLYTGQGATVRALHWRTDWSKIGKVQQGCVHAEDIVWNAALDESQARIKIAREISTTSDM